ncbi:MAG: hypothetical protein ABL967_00840 [Bryobacteraceae bacterium]
MKMSRIFSLIVLAGALGLSASAAEVKGILTDRLCAAKIATGGQAAAKAHERSCAMTPPCEQSGYGVFTADNRFLWFNGTGNTKAIEALKASTKKDNLTVTVIGAIKGQTLEVADLKLD